MIKLIEQKRKKKGYTIKEFCKKLNISVREYYYIKSGHHKLIKKTTLDIFRLLDIEEVNINKF